ncbi:MAG: hypothetical protein LUQ65_02445 [Candidatus Helarchaeota archaeon]|nr:hypothetical protein [Candidatus Helarchaeota archaeon]
MENLKAKGAKILDEIGVKFDKFIAIATEIEEMRCKEERDCAEKDLSPCATTLAIFTVLQAFLSTIKDYYSSGGAKKPMLPDSIDILDEIIQKLGEYSQRLECNRGS